jgi:SAM-dependent methyltransferase
MSDKIKSLQDDEYCFPYHYVSGMPSQGGFVQHFVDTWGMNYIATIEYILTRVKEINASAIVDVGCGDGRLVRELVLKFPDKHITGIDYSTRAISLARAMNPDLQGVEFHSLDITSATHGLKYDIAILMEVFEHIPPEDSECFLEALRSLLNRDGILLLTVPHANKPVEYKHYRHFSCAGILDILSKYFDVIEVRPFERSGLLRRVLDRVLCNRFFVLNNRRISDFIYKLQKKYLFECSEKNCQRIFVKAIPKKI